MSRQRTYFCLATVGGLAAIGFLAWPAYPAWADDTPTVTRIEEDWEMVIRAPSPSSDAPQVICAISPLGDLNSLHATFVVNNHEVPNYAPGGLQLQLWDGKTLLDSKRTPNQAILSTPGETICWTQTMSKTDGGLMFQITNGTSTTWGSFGDDGTLKLTATTSLKSLNQYSPDISAEQSGVSYAGNRVESLVLKRVRVYTDAGLLVEDATPRTVHSLSQ